MSNIHMQIKKWVIILILLPFISGCAGIVHKRFVQNFSNERQGTDGSFSNLVANLAYNDKKQLLAVGFESGQIEIWDINKTHSKIGFKAHEYPASMISFTADGTALFSSSKFEESTKIWSVKSGALIQAIRKMKGPVGTTPNKNIYVVANGEYVSLYNLSREIIFPEKYPSGGLITAIATDVSSGLIAIGSESGTIEVWRYSESMGTKVLVKVSSVRAYSLGDWVVGLQFSSKGDSLYSVARFGAINEWAPETMEKRRTVPTAFKHIFSAAFYREEDMLSLAGNELKNSLGASAVEVISLATNESRIYPISTNFARVEILPPLSATIAVESRSAKTYELPAKSWFR